MSAPISAAAANSASYWRIAGMSYLKYANLCAEVVRGSLKEPFYTDAHDRENVYYKQVKWTKGQPEDPVITKVVPSGPKKKNPIG